MGEETGCVYIRSYSPSPPAAVLNICSFMVLSFAVWGRSDHTGPWYHNHHSLRAFCPYYQPLASAGAVSSSSYIPETPASELSLLMFAILLTMVGHHGSPGLEVLPLFSRMRNGSSKHSVMWSHTNE